MKHERAGRDDRTRGGGVEEEEGGGELEQSRVE